MLAIIAAIVFGIALLLDLLNISTGSTIDLLTFVILGLLLMALHAGGVGSAWGGRSTGWYRNRRRRTRA